MKVFNIFKTPVLFFVLYIGSGASLNGQTQLYGDWNVTCLGEYSTASSMHFCSLCPSKIGDITIDVNDFEMNVNKDELKLKMNNVTTAVKYLWDENIKKIEFTYNKTIYSFQILSGNDQKHYTLKSKEGRIITLEKINSKGS